MMLQLFIAIYLASGCFADILDCGNGSKLSRIGCFTKNDNAPTKFIMRKPVYGDGSIKSLACDCAAKAKEGALVLTDYEECFETKAADHGNRYPGQTSYEKCINTVFHHCEKGQNCIGTTDSVYIYAKVVDGKWSTWSAVGACNRKCGPGRRRFTRKCNNPKPAFGGKSCEGPKIKFESCNNGACPVNGKWSTWSSFGACNRRCGPGRRRATRNCNNPKPAFGGKSCIGPKIKFESCNNGACIPDLRNQGQNCWKKPTYFCGKKGLCSRKGWGQWQDAAFPCVNRHCCTEPALVKNLGSNCWWKCGKKGGYCPGFCGVNGRCCRRGWNDAGCAGMATPCNGKHCCTTKRRDVQNSGKNCWWKCNKKDGECSTGFCGKDGVCCRRGWDTYRCIRTTGACRYKHCCVGTAAMGIQKP
uniref:Uncharacterized protein n=2 Tax=Clytia hemisphaerica TaxID=252671 RepID=A0A7M5XDD6_9CNID